MPDLRAKTISFWRGFRIRGRFFELAVADTAPAVGFWLTLAARNSTRRTVPYPIRRSRAIARKLRPASRSCCTRLVSTSRRGRPPGRPALISRSRLVGFTAHLQIPGLFAFSIGTAKLAGLYPSQSLRAAENRPRMFAIWQFCEVESASAVLTLA